MLRGQHLGRAAVQAFERSPYAPGVQEGMHSDGQGEPKQEMKTPQGQEMRASVLSDRSYGVARRQQASAHPSFHCPSDVICKMLVKLVYHRKLPEQRK